MIESTDVVFAVDSIPAILAVSREQFIVFSSNAFAILGLRALYFLLAGMADSFRYLNMGLGVILAFVGVKMLLTDVYHFPTGSRWVSSSRADGLGPGIATSRSTRGATNPITLPPWASQTSCESACLAASTSKGSTSGHSEAARGARS